MFRRLIPAVLTGAGLCCAAGSAAAANLRVPQDFPTIQSAIDAAPGGATVVVAPGTYRENLLIEKALTLRSVSGAGDTVIDGQGVGPVVVARGTGTEPVTLDGFTITNGFNNFSISAGSAPGNAGGIYMESVVGVVTDNVVRDNVGCIGSGISTLSAAVTIQRNQIRDNRQDPSCGGADGGGIFLRADGVQPSLVVRNIVSGHRTGGRGAGVAIQGMSDVTIRDNLISGNEANDPGAGAGGGIFINVANATISGNVLVGNSAQSGGGMALFPIDNANRVVAQGNVMANNLATSEGSAIFLVTVSNTSLRLTGNIADGSTASSLVHCGGVQFTVPASNLLHNGQGPVLGGNCVSP